MTHFAMFRNFVALLAFLGLTLNFAATSSIAGPLAVTNFAYNNGVGPDAGQWHGSVAIAGAAFGDTVVAEVDWAVFEPGDFQQYLDSQAIAQIDPSGPNELTYVYQIHSVTNANPGIDVLSVGLDAIDGRGTLSAPSHVPTGAANEQLPTGGGDNNTSMAWFFGGAELLPGDSSSLLVFTSQYDPEYDFLTVSSGVAGPAVSPLVPSPSAILGDPGIPEPSTLILALGFIVTLVAGRRKR